AIVMKRVGYAIGRAIATWLELEKKSERYRLTTDGNIVGTYDDYERLMDVVESMLGKSSKIDIDRV
ncbi:MAG: hypothetical protein ACRC5C_14830, partial [Bacilli bacterium]